MTTATENNEVTLTDRQQLEREASELEAIARLINEGVARDYWLDQSQQWQEKAEAIECENEDGEEV